MKLSLQTFSGLVQNAAAAVQSSAGSLVDLAAGSSLRAVLEANASVGLWMQWLVAQVLQTTRAGTSTGGDLDTWLGDFGVTRLPATAAVGQASFARYTATLPAVVPVGALIRTADGTQTYAVTADPTNAAYNAATGGYALPAGQGGVTVPIAAQAPGSAGNVLAGTITSLVTALPGIDTVVNAAPLGGGLDAESDADARVRFQSFLDTRSRATARAIGYAIAGVQQGLRYVVAENTDPSGAVRPGSFVVTVDDGSGAPSAALLASAYAAIDAVRPLGSIFSVQPPQQQSVAIAATLTVNPSSQKAAAIAAASTAIAGYIASLPLGGTLATTRVARAAYEASGAIANVANVTINGNAADLVLPPNSVAISGGMVLS